MWTIAHFRISTEATSTHPRTTVFSAGTAYYRAPELLSDDPIYINKVDIWALGCILYKLVFDKWSFAGD